MKKYKMQRLLINLRNALKENAMNGDITKKIAKFYKVGYRSVARVIADYKKCNSNKSGRPKKLLKAKQKLQGDLQLRINYIARKMQFLLAVVCQRAFQLL